MTRGELIEKVAMAIECVDHPYSVEHIAKAAIETVLEEAARVAEKTYNNYQDEFCSNWNAACRRIARDIRALKGE